MKTLSIDIETYSGADLPTVGAYRYTLDPDFRILLFAYSIDEGPVQVVDLAQGEQLPEEVRDALTDPSVVKWAYNAQFERVCISRWLKLKDQEFLDPRQWRCSMVLAGYLGLPMQLEAVGKALGLEQQKLASGKSLIRYWCQPCKPTKANGGRTVNLPVHDPEKWEEFKEYNKRDVEVELAIKSRCARIQPPDWLWEEYATDQRINDNGMGVDYELVAGAIHVDEVYRRKVRGELDAITGLENSNSVVQLQSWLNDHGCPIESMRKDAVADALEQAEGEAKRVLELRAELGKTSTKKYNRMQSTVTASDRIHGLTQFYGANRTGRWAGRLVQVQNLPRNYLPDLDLARELVKNKDVETLDLLYGNVPDTLSQLIRTAFVPTYGHKFLVADFSAIEARVLAWLADEQVPLQAFADGKDIYCEVASAMFGVPVEKHGENSELRQKGKVATLACGYQGSVGALKAMGADRMGLDEDEMKRIVDAWRTANPKIVNMWWSINRAALDAIQGKATKVGKCTIGKRSGAMFISLPSGRELYYPGVAEGTNRFGGESITYMGVGDTNKWERLETYGGKLTENITQAVARDILAYAMSNVEERCPIVAHVHDEVILEAPKENADESELNTICDVMSETPDWAEGLPLAAEGFISDYYKKD